MHWSLSLAASLRSSQLEHIKQSRLKDYDTPGYGYWLSYPGDECLKCNCSLNATIVFQYQYIHQLQCGKSSDCDRILDNIH